MLLVEVTVFVNIFLEINLPILRYFLATVALFCFVTGVFQCRLKFRSPISKSYLVISFVLLMWIFYMIFRGFPLIISGFSNHLFFKQFISGQLLLYLIPLVLFVRPDEYFIKRIFRFSFNLSLLYLIAFFPFSVIIGIGWGNYHFLEQSAYYFAAPAGMLLLTLPYHSHRVKLISLLTIGIAIVIMAILARRSSLGYYGSIIGFSAILINFSLSPIVNKTRLVSMFFTFSVAAVGLVALLFNLDKFSYLAEKSQDGFSNREIVFLEFFVDMDKDPKDWVVGRGINGTFKSISLANFKNNVRDGIENGYLQAILKGGYIYLGLIIFLSLGAMLNGFFRSKNLLSKACAAFIFIQFIEMIGFGLPSLTVKYLFFWIAIVSCFYKPILNNSDFKLKNTVGLT